MHIIQAWKHWAFVQQGSQDRKWKRAGGAEDVQLANQSSLRWETNSTSEQKAGPWRRGRLEGLDGTPLEQIKSVLVY